MRNKTGSWPDQVRTDMGSCRLEYDVGRGLGTGQRMHVSVP